MATAEEEEDTGNFWRWEGIRRLKQCDAFFNHKCVLSKSKFFAGRSQNFLQALVQTLTVDIYTPGQDIIREGDVGNKAYFLNRGTVDILVANAKVKVATLEDGAVFGEMAMFGQGKRSATCRATEVCDCRVLHFGQFQQALRLFPQEKAYFQALAAERMAETAEAKKKEMMKRRSSLPAKAAVAVGKAKADGSTQGGHLKLPTTRRSSAPHVDLQPTKRSSTDPIEIKLPEPQPKLAGLKVPPATFRSISDVSSALLLGKFSLPSPSSSASSSRSSSAEPSGSELEKVGAPPRDQALQDKDRKEAEMMRQLLEEAPRLATEEPREATGEELVSDIWRRDISTGTEDLTLDCLSEWPSSKPAEMPREAKRGDPCEEPVNDNWRRDISTGTEDLTFDCLSEWPSSKPAAPALPELVSSAPPGRPSASSDNRNSHRLQYVNGKFALVQAEELTPVQPSEPRSPTTPWLATRTRHCKLQGRSAT